jgi:hypothetical protein
LDIPGVTRCPTDRWVAQQLREATAWGRTPKYLLQNNDAKFGVEFDALANNTGIKLVHTAVHVPVMNSVCERFIGPVPSSGDASGERLGAVARQIGVRLLEHDLGHYQKLMVTTMVSV